ncbi:MAG: hypothetical protein ABI679_05880 [Gemmatimonadota bacterium]
MSGVVILACSADGAGNRGILDVSWSGSDTGRLHVAARGYWCREDSVLVIRGERGDSGIAVALFPRDSVTRDSFTIDGVGQSAARPHGRVGLRWLGENLVVGYYSLSGTAVVNSDSPLEGRVQATLKSAVDGTQIKIAGTFSKLDILPSPSGCGRGIRPDSGGS